MRAWLPIIAALAACGHGVAGFSADAGPDDAGADGGGVIVVDDTVDVPVAGATADQIATFKKGNSLFERVYGPGDGLGPVFIRQQCSSCHQTAGKGPGLVRKMALFAQDGVTPLADQSALQWGHTTRPFTAGGGMTPLLPPDGGLPAGAQVKLTNRFGPALYGRGYLEAIDDAAILAAEAAQAVRTDGIHGQANRVTYRSQPNPDTRYHHHQPGEQNLIGRFGLKARQPTLDDFTADAFQGDMGLTTPLRPSELPNPDGLADDFKDGTDVDVDTVNALAEYLRLIAIPQRAPADPAAVALFSRLRCDVCHLPSLRTRADYPVPQLAAIDAPVYTDLLLHDLGPALADGVGEESAGSSQWRTAPLIGLRFQKASRFFLHDGSARTVDEAIRKHGGEGAQAANDFAVLSDADRKLLVDFVESL